VEFEGPIELAVRYERAKSEVIYLEWRAALRRE